MEFGTLYLICFQYFLRLSIILSGLRSLSHFGFIYIYLLRFATWEAMPRVKVLKGFCCSERFSFGLSSCNYFEKKWVLNGLRK